MSQPDPIATIQFDSVDQLKEHIKLSWFRTEYQVSGNKTLYDAFINRLVYTSENTFKKIPNTFILLDNYFLYIPENDSFFGEEVPDINAGETEIPVYVIASISLNEDNNGITINQYDYTGDDKYEEKLIFYLEGSSIVCEIDRSQIVVKMILNDNDPNTCFPKYNLTSDAATFASYIVDRQHVTLCQYRFYNKVSEKIGEDNEKFLLEYYDYHGYEYACDIINFKNFIGKFRGCISINTSSDIDNEKYFYINVISVKTLSQDQCTVVADIGSYTSKIFNRCIISIEFEYSGNLLFCPNGDYTCNINYLKIGDTITCYMLKENAIKCKTPTDPREVLYVNSDNRYIDRLYRTFRGSIVGVYDSYSNIPSGPVVPDDFSKQSFMYYIDGVIYDFKKGTYGDKTLYIRYLDNENKIKDINQPFNMSSSRLEYSDITIINLANNNLYGHPNGGIPYLDTFNLRLNEELKFTLFDSSYDEYYPQVFYHVTCTMKEFSHYVGSCSSDSLSIDQITHMLKTTGTKYRLQAYNPKWTGKEMPGLQVIDDRYLMRGDSLPDAFTVEIVMENIDAYNGGTYFDSSAGYEQPFYMYITVDVKDKKMTCTYKENDKQVFEGVTVLEDGGNITITKDSDVITLYQSENKLSYTRDQHDFLPPNIKWDENKKISYEMSLIYSTVESAVAVYTNRCYNKSIDRFPTELQSKIAALFDESRLSYFTLDEVGTKTIHGTFEGNFTIAVYNVGERSFIVGYRTANENLTEIVLYDFDINVIQTIKMDSEVEIKTEIKGEELKVTYKLDIDIIIIGGVEGVENVYMEYHDYWYNHADGNATLYGFFSGFEKDN